MARCPVMCSRDLWNRRGTKCPLCLRRKRTRVRQREPENLAASKMIQAECYRWEYPRQQNSPACRALPLSVRLKEWQADLRPESRPQRDFRTWSWP